MSLCRSTGLVREDRSGRQYTADWDRCLPSFIAFKTLREAEQFRS
ncbi:MAG: hypothetical protein ACE5JX_12440 [Acidobacteriota bacterium]